MTQPQPTALGTYLLKRMDSHDPQLSQGELARLAGVTQPTLSRWIFGRVQPKPENLLLIARALSPAGASKRAITEEYETLLRLAEDGQADSEVSAIPQLLIEIERLISDTSPLPMEKRDMLRFVLNQLVEPYRPYLRGHHARLRDNRPA